MSCDFFSLKFASACGFFSWAWTRSLHCVCVFLILCLQDHKGAWLALLHARCFPCLSQVFVFCIHSLCRVLWKIGNVDDLFAFASWHLCYADFLHASVCGLLSLFVIFAFVGR